MSGAGHVMMPAPGLATSRQIRWGTTLNWYRQKPTFDIPARQSGGAVTAILANALDEGLIDAVVTVTEDRWSLKPSSVVITRSDVLIQQAGSRYSWWVPLLAALKNAVIERKFRRIAVVGFPAQSRHLHGSGRATTTSSYPMQNRYALSSDYSVPRPSIIPHLSKENSETITRSSP